MRQDSETAHKIKTQIAAFSRELTVPLKRPAAQFVFQMVYGIVASGSLHLSKIGRALHGREPLLATIKRLSRHLKNPVIGKTLQRTYLEHMRCQVKPHTVLAVDVSEIVKPYAKAMEHLGQVYDGSTKETNEPGYNFISVVAATATRVVPLYGDLYSNVAPEWVSENVEILQAIHEVRRVTGGKGIFAIDRGGDRPVFFEEFLKNGDDFIVRLNDTRTLVREDDGCVLPAPEIAQQIKPRYAQTIEVAREGIREKKTLRYGSVRVRLPEFLSYRLWLVVIFGFGQKPILLMTNLPAGGELILKRAANYLSRWRCEEEIRFLKQGFALEDVRVLRYQRLQNIMVLAVAAMGFLSRVGYTITSLQPLSEKILKESKRIFHIPTFRYYALHDGIRSFLATYRGRVSFPRQVRIRNGQLTLFDLPENFG